MITGGVVKYLKRIKPGADYEHEEASAELRFDVPDGHDYQPYYDKAADEAKTKVLMMLGIVKSEARGPGRPPKIGRVDAAAAVATRTTDNSPLDALAKAPPPADAPAVASMRQSDPALADGLAAVTAAIQAERGVSPLDDILGDLGGASKVENAGPSADTAASGSADPTDMNFEAPVPEKEITTKEMNEACGAHVIKRKTAGYAVSQDIRLLIGKFATGTPGQLANIPQGLRRKFLEEMSLLDGKKL